MSMNIGLTGLKAASTHLDVASHNIANASTTGFKSGRAEFGDMVDPNAEMSPGLGVKTEAIDQQFTQGTPTMTGEALDLAINGNGFFAVKDAAGTISYTRAGNFHVNDKGFIVNDLDQQLLDTSSKPISIPSPYTDADLAVDKYGSITGYGPGISIPPVQIGLVNFRDVNCLKRIGDTQWVDTAASGPPIIGTPGSGTFGSLSSGELEASNVDITQQLVEVIIAQRDFQANAQTITAGNNMVQTIINIR